VRYFDGAVYISFSFNIFDIITCFSEATTFDCSIDAFHVFVEKRGSEEVELLETWSSREISTFEDTDFRNRSVYIGYSVYPRGEVLKG
jgi:hypothetical protein